jgi:hypothetical protein
MPVPYVMWLKQKGNKMNNKLVAALILLNVVLVVLGNIINSEQLWVPFDIYGAVVSALAGYRLLKA